MAGVPVWSHHGIVCTGESYTKVVKLTFARGATVPDSSRLFNASMEGTTRRAIDIREGERVDARAFKALVKAAVARNGPPAKKAQVGARAATPVQAYLASIPGWQRDLGTRLDALIVRHAPKARKAVKWNSPFYGTEGQGWFVKVAFFRGTSCVRCRPAPARVRTRATSTSAKATSS